MPTDVALQPHEPHTIGVHQRSKWLVKADRRHELRGRKGVDRPPDQEAPAVRTAPPISVVEEDQPDS